MQSHKQAAYKHSQTTPSKTKQNKPNSHINLHITNNKQQTINYNTNNIFN